MPTIDISDQARQDRDAIWRFSLGQWSDERADTYIVGLHAKLIAAAETPHRSPKVDIRPNCRKLLSASRYIYYRPVSGGIRVLRILHQSMDVAQHLMK